MNMKMLATDLKKYLPNHKYIDKITSYSPSYKRISRKGQRHSSFMYEMQKSNLQSQNNSSRYNPQTSAISAKNTRRQNLDGPTYLPGVSKIEHPPSLTGMLKEHKQLKTHQIKNWLKRRV